MSSECQALIVERIQQHGPITFAEFMELALYGPGVGYYARATRRSGRAGDFYTSVDAGSVFGELLAQQFAEMFRVIDEKAEGGRRKAEAYDLVEAGAGNGRLSRDVLDALRIVAPDVYERLRVHLVERSAAAREEHAVTLADHLSKLSRFATALPSPIDGVVFANELLDALPTHAVAGTQDGLREVFIDVEGGHLVERIGPLSTTAIADYLDRAGAQLQPGWRAEVNLGAVRWISEAARALQRGFLVVIDYGHAANILYSASHSAGTLATFREHVVEVRRGDRRPPWLRDPGSSDITAHVDLTSLRRAAEDAGLTTLCVTDQMHFLVALGIDRPLSETGDERHRLARRLALKTLVVPGGLGTTHRVMVFGKNVGSPRLTGCGSVRTPSR